MKLTILETGLVPEKVAGDFPSYPAMFETLIGAADPSLTFETVSVVSGEPLPDPATLEAILITGSPAGVYDDTPWMQPLMTFIRGAAEVGVPQVGICFGHQAMAEALGGKVVKSDKGWGIGRHTYEVCGRPGWMGSVPADQFAISVSHQDQVIAAPEGATLIAWSDFCPFAALSYAQGPAISFQGHPEFEDDYSAALYKSRQHRPLTEAQVSAAIQSMKAEAHDNALVGQWMASFLAASNPASR